MKRFFLIILAALAFTILAKAEVFEAHIEQASGEDGAYAQFKLWIPPASHPTGLIVLTWGGNQCSLNVVNDPGWQNLATSMGAGLLTCFFAPQTTANHWDHAAEGSGQALLDALPVLAKMSGESQLPDARLYLVGDSQGGQFSFSFAGWKPDRVIGFVSLKGGRHEASSVEGAAKVPGLFFAGEADVSYRVENIKQTFLLGRAKGAPWCFAIDKQGNHEPGPCAPLLHSFLQALSGLQRVLIPVSKEESGHSDLNPSSFSWFITTKFKNDWATFESGKVDSNMASLSFESNMPALAGTSDPPSCDLGALDSGENSKLVTIKVNPNSLSHWNSVKILDRPYLSEAKVSTVSPRASLVSFRLNTEGLPLGRFSGILPLRFDEPGNSVPGCLNVPLRANVVGDVTAYPSFIYLDPANAGKTVSVKIEISSKSKQSIQLLPSAMPRGVSMTSDSNSKSPLTLTVLFNPHAVDSSLAGEKTIWLHLLTTKEWTLRVPYVEPTSQR